MILMVEQNSMSKVPMSGTGFHAKGKAVFSAGFIMASFHIHWIFTVKGLNKYESFILILLFKSLVATPCFVYYIEIH